MDQRSRVALTHCAEIESGIRQALDLLGDLGALFEKKHVAIKPNDTWASGDDVTACTQADSVQAVIRYVKKFNPQCITVSGGAGDGQTEEVFRLLGIDRVIREEEVRFFDHNLPPFRAVALNHGPQKEVMINPHVLDYDTIISLAQHKVHQYATVTLTMKNIAMSFPAADYYGHPREMVVHHHYFFEDLQSFIAGMCQRFAPRLGIIVGHPAMIGTGPIGGKTFESGIVIASTDFVAADSVGAWLLGEGKVSHIVQAEELGLGTADRTKLAIAGISLDEAEEIFARAAEGA